MNFVINPSATRLSRRCVASARSAWLTSAISLISWGCGPDTSDHAEAHSTDVALECEESSGGCFDPAWEVIGDHVAVRLTEALPGEPERGSNAWRVKLTHVEETQADDAIEGCSITVTPYMPEHGHGVPLAPLVEDEGGGIYHIKEINFTMPGLWEMRFEIECDSSGSITRDELVYAFWLNS